MKGMEGRRYKGKGVDGVVVVMEAYVQSRRLRRVV